MTAQWYLYIFSLYLIPPIQNSNLWLFQTVCRKLQEECQNPRGGRKSFIMQFLIFRKTNWLSSISSHSISNKITPCLQHVRILPNISTAYLRFFCPYVLILRSGQSPFCSPLAGTLVLLRTTLHTERRFKILFYLKLWLRRSACNSQQLKDQVG